MPAMFWTTPELWHFGRFCGGDLAAWQHSLCQPAAFTAEQ